MIGLNKLDKAKEILQEHLNRVGESSIKFKESLELIESKEKELKTYDDQLRVDDKPAALPSWYKSYILANSIYFRDKKPHIQSMKEIPFDFVYYAV